MVFSVGEPRGTGHRARLLSAACLVGLIVVLPQGFVSAWAWEQNLRGAYLMVMSFFFASLLVPASIVLAFKLGAIDQPSERKVHNVATPRLGGLAVYAATMLTLLRNHQWSQGLTALCAAGTVIFVMGVVDDVRGLSARFRLVGQLLAAAIAIGGGVCVTFVPEGFPGERFLEIGMTAFWLVGITNAINFLDGIDGLAGGFGSLCATLLLSIAWPERQKHLAFASSALAGACLGFLPFNWQPARVFLGDGGSTFIGFMLGGLAVMCSESDQLRLVAISTPLLILSIPVFDMIYTTLSRIRRGAVRNVREWLEFTGRDHFHHRLMNLGLSVPGAVGFILLTNLCIGLGAIVIHHTSSRLATALMLAQTFLLFVIIVVLMLLGRELTP